MSSIFFSFYFPHSSDDDFEEVEFGSGSEPEVVIQDSKERILMFFCVLAYSDGNAPDVSRSIPTIS